MMTSAMPVIPNYHVLRKLSQGGMGTVYEAMHTKLGKRVAVKVLRPNLARDLEAEVRFEREMKIIGTLDHPHIVQARDAGKANGTHYLVMECLVGCDLAGLVSKRGPLKIADACEITRRAAVALQYAEKYSLVHRDIKPKNVLIGRSSGADGPVQVKVADFGLVLLRGYPKDRDSKSSAEIVGTFAFMAPEQFWEQTSDIRSDIYSLGCTLYYLLLGQPPFSQSQYPGPRQLMEADRNAIVPSLQRTRDDVGDALQAMINQMLAKQPADRQQSPAEASEQLAGFTAGYDLNLLMDDDDKPVAAAIRVAAVDISETISLPGGADSVADTHSLTSDLYPTSPDLVPNTDLYNAQSLASSKNKTVRRRWIAFLLGMALLVTAYPWLSRYFVPGPIDLLADINLQRDALSGDWEMNNNVLTSPDQPRAQLALHHDVPTAYRLEIDAHQKTGGRMIIGLIHDGHQYAIVLDATMVGSNGISEQASQAASRRRAQKLGFTRGAPNTYTCIVQDQGVLVAFENQIRFAVEPSELKSVANDQWRTNGYAGLFIGTHNSIYEFHKIVLTAINE